MVNSLYFVEKLSKKILLYNKKELSGSLLLDFVLRNLSKSGWRFKGDTDRITFSEE